MHHRSFAAVALAITVTACSAPSPRATPSRATVSTTMHANFAAVRDIYRALIVDDLATARARADELARMASPREAEDWSRATGFLRAQAARLTDASTASEGRRLSTAMATYCADCHMFRADPSSFRAANRPADDGSARAAMARHAWGAETMWLGIIAPSTDLWRSGLAELAAAPRVGVRGERAREVAVLNARLSALAWRSGDRLGQNDRAGRLAEILDVCAACHSITRP